MNKKKRNYTNINIINKNQYQNQNGGKYISSGTFGCVVSPALPCNKTQKANYKSSSKFSKKYISKNKNVSKIILSPDSEAKDELNISNKLHKIDPHNKYFITIEDACYIKDLPDNRSDAIRVHYDDYDKMDTKYKILDKHKHIDKKFCKVDMRLKPINFILPYGGYDLFDVIVSKSKDPYLAITRKLIIKQFKHCFKNLLYGIFKMQDNRIVNRDIKLENIMANYNEKTKNVDLKFIDFGLSEKLTSDFCSPKNKYKNILKVAGTEDFISPELYIIEILGAIKNYNYTSDSNNLFSRLFGINDKEKHNGHDIDNNIKLNNEIYIEITKIINKFPRKMLLSFNEHEIALHLKNILNKMIDNISKEFTSDDIYHRFFGTIHNKYNGYLQKGDIYALGITVYEFLENYKKEFNNYEYINVKTNLKLYNLLKNMIEPDPDLRFNIIQCMKHPYFK